MSLKKIFWGWILLIVMSLFLFIACSVAPVGGGGGGGGGETPTPPALVDGSNYFDTTNTFYTDITGTTNSNEILAACWWEVFVTNTGTYSNEVTNWLLELSNNLEITNILTNLSNYSYEGTSNFSAIYTNGLYTNSYETTNLLDFLVTNTNISSNGVFTGWEVTETFEGVYSNVISNWVIAYEQLYNVPVTTNTNYSTTNYEWLYDGSYSTNYTNTFTTNIIDTTNTTGSDVWTNTNTGIGFIGKFWYTNITYDGLSEYVVTNNVYEYTNGVETTNYYSNHYYITNAASQTNSVSNFGIHVGIEMTNEDANTVAVWELNEGTGQTAADGSANGWNLTLGATGGVEGTDPTWTNWNMPGYGIGSFSNSLSFDSAGSQYAWWSGNYAQGTAVTVGFWMRTTNNTGILVSAGMSNYQVHLANNNINCTVGDGTTWLVYSMSAGTITNGQWHYISIVYPIINGLNTRIRIHIDGVQAGQSGDVGVVGLGQVTNIYIGGQPSFGSYFNGQIDNVRIQNVVNSDQGTYFTAATNAD